MSRAHRLYWPETLSLQQTITLSREQSKHLVQVLRHQVGDTCHLFNNQGEYSARIVYTSPTRTQLSIETMLSEATPPPYSVTIAQSIPHAKKLDLVIQKASELGATGVQPLVSERGLAHYNHERAVKIATAAAMQCQRTKPLTVAHSCNLLAWLAEQTADVRLLAHHPSLCSHVPMVHLDNCVPKSAMHITWLIGPEGGFSADELHAIAHAGFVGVQLSDYILRTETVALAALAVTDYWWRSHDLRSQAAFASGTVD